MIKWIPSSDDSDHDLETGAQPDTPEAQSKTQHEMYIDTPAAIASLNQCLPEIGVTTYSKTKACKPHYPEEKIEEITQAMKKLLITTKPESDDESEIIKQLKEKFKITTQRSEQIQILTVLPQSWSIAHPSAYLQSPFKPHNEIYTNERVFTNTHWDKILKKKKTGLFKKTRFKVYKPHPPAVTLSSEAI